MFTEVFDIMDDENNEEDNFELSQVKKNNVKTKYRTQYSP